MTEQFLDEAWIHQLSKFSVLYVGFSGGLDSTVLLHSLAAQPALFQKLHAIHINHGLSAHALVWELHCQEICCDLNVKISTYCVNIDAQQNLEERARIARYEVFHSLLTSSDALILAHHQDDQAETLLLNLMRGTGIDGLAAMSGIQSLAQGAVIRPFLTHSRTAIEAYAKQYGLKWVEDESNQNMAFSRNFLRHQVMPLLKEKWPSAVKNIARGAYHCRQAKQNLETLAQVDGLDLSKPSWRLPLSMLTSLTRERSLNILRVWIKQNGHKMPSENALNRVMDEMVLVRQDANPMVSFGGVVIRRYREHLYYLLEQRLITESTHWSNFPNPLNLGHTTLSVNYADQGMKIFSTQRVEVRFRIGGERFGLRGQTKLLKKLWQEWGVPPWMRDTIPLIYVDDVLAAIVGYEIGDEFYISQSKALGHEQFPVIICN